PLEAPQRLREKLRLRDRVGVEPDPLEARKHLFELALEPLRPGAEAREVGRAAFGAGARRRLGMAAVMAAERPVAVEDERHVTVVAAARHAARAAMDGRRNAAAVQQEDRLAATPVEALELLQERSGERIPALAPQVDDAHGRQRPGDP